MQFSSRPDRGRIYAQLATDPIFRRCLKVALALLVLTAASALVLGFGLLLMNYQTESEGGGLGLPRGGVDWWSHSYLGTLMTYFVIIGLVATIVVLGLALNNADRRLRFRSQYLNTALGTIGDLQGALNAIQSALQDTSGGVHKRIDEIREVAEAILKHQPDLYQRVPGLLFWLRAEDEFLCAVRDQAFPAGCDSYHGEIREIYAFSPRKADIFQAIEQMKLPQQGSLYAVQLTLYGENGGVHKRIEEVREIAEAILKHQPDLYQRVPGLLFWLQAQDAFLRAVRDQAIPPGSDIYTDGMRELSTRAPRLADIFKAIKQTKCPDPLTPSN